MIGGTTFSEVFGSVPPGDPERLANIARAAVRAGLAVVLCRTADKAPLCTLTQRERKAADAQAVQAARDRGENRPEARTHPCGLNHAFTDPDKAFRVVNRLVKSGLVPNLGVELGRSRMVNVDVDSASELAAFLLDRTVHEGPADRSLTVRSPGKLSRDGETWAHRDGGHFWFTVPDGLEIPSGAGVYKASSGWVVSWADHQVLVPPSSRAEGSYELLSEPEALPAWLAELIIGVAKIRDDRRKERATLVIDSDDPIERWSILTPWADLLGPDEWTDTGQIDNCSCPIWTAPGVHAHWKSATAHDLGCAVFDATTGWGPLRVWTDSPALDGIEGGRTYTKLQYVAARDHDGIQRSAMQALGLAAGVSDQEFPGFDPRVDNEPLSVDPPAPEGHPDVKDPWDATPQTADEVEKDDPVADLIATWLGSAGLEGIPDPEPVIEGVLDLDTLARVIGKSGHGKSFVMIDMACAVATGQPWQGRPVTQGLVVYMVAEGARGFKRRIRAWESRHHAGVPIPDTSLQVIPYPIQATDAKAWRVYRAALSRLKPVMVVMDTQARITVGANENDPQDMSVLTERVEQVRRETAACTVLVHHLGHQGDHGRGHSSMLGAVNSEIRVTKDGDELTVYCDKQKDDGAFEPIVLVLEPEAESVVLVSPAALVDPFTSAEPFGQAGTSAQSWEQLLFIAWDQGGRVGMTRDLLKGAFASYALTQHGKPFAMPKTFNRAWTKLIESGELVGIEGRASYYRVTDEAVERYGIRRTIPGQRQPVD